MSLLEYAIQGFEQNSALLVRDGANPKRQHVQNMVVMLELAMLEAQSFSDMDLVFEALMSSNVKLAAAYSILDQAEWESEDNSP